MPKVRSPIFYYLSLTALRKTIFRMSLFRPLFTPLVPKIRNALCVRQFRIGKSPRKDEIFLIPIESIDKHGNGRTTIEWDSMQKQLEPTIVTVRGALLGETVRVRVVSVYSKSGSAIHTVRVNIFGRREVLIRPQIDNQPWRSNLEPEFLPLGHQESASLTKFTCPHFDPRHDEKSCSGCTVPHMQYTAQISAKLRLLKAALSGAVDDSFLSELFIEPRSQLTHFSSRHEIFAFSPRPLGEPVWGQLSAMPPVPGERRDKYYIATPDCKLLPKSANNILYKMAHLIAVAQGNNPGLFSVYNEILNRGFLRSAVIQTNQHGDKFLLSIVTATKPSPNFQAALTIQIAEPLMAQFPGLQGVCLVEARIDTEKDDEMFAGHYQVLAGKGEFDEHFIGNRGESFVVRITPGSRGYNGSEILKKIAKEISLLDNTGGEEIVEFFASRDNNAITSILKQVGGVVDGHALLGDTGDEQKLLPLTSEEDVAMGGSTGQDKCIVRTAVLSYPKNEGKSEIKGVTSKKFRHWLGGVIKPDRIVIITDKFDGLRKDIGHMKLMGYDIEKIKAFDSQPGVMDKIVVFVVLKQRNGDKYNTLDNHQLIG